MQNIKRPIARRPQLGTPIDLKLKSNIIVCVFDLDNTVIQFDTDMGDRDDDIVYTGFSKERWQYFCEALTIIARMRGLKIVFAVITAKTINGYNERLVSEKIPVPTINLQEYLTENGKKIDDTVGDIVVRDVLTSLSQYIQFSDVFFSQGNDKSVALKLLADQYNADQRNVWMHDDSIVVIDAIKKSGFSGVLVPSKMYNIYTKKQTREQACINWMMQVLIMQNAPLVVYLEEKSKKGILSADQAALLQIYIKINQSVLPSLQVTEVVEDFAILSLAGDDDGFVVVEKSEKRQALDSLALTKPKFSASSQAQEDYFASPKKKIIATDSKITVVTALAPDHAMPTVSETQSAFDKLMLLMLTNFSTQQGALPSDIAKAHNLLKLEGIMLKNGLEYFLKKNHVPQEMKISSQAISKSKFDSTIECPKNSLLFQVARVIVDKQKDLQLKEDSILLCSAQYRIGHFEL